MQVKGNVRNMFLDSPTSQMMNGGDNMAKKMPEIGDYKYGFHDKDVSIFRSERGLTEEIVREISKIARAHV